MVFASIREHASTAIFLRARTEIKKLLCQLFASSEQFREYRLAGSEHFLYFPLAAIHMENLFFKIKQEMV